MDRWCCCPGASSVDRRREHCTQAFIPRCARGRPPASSSKGTGVVEYDVETAELVRSKGGAAVALRGNVSRMADHEAASVCRVRVSASRRHIQQRRCPSRNSRRPTSCTHRGVKFLVQVLVAMAAVPQMKRQGGGTILFTSSASAMWGSRLRDLRREQGRGERDAWSPALAVDLGKYGIRVNCISPLWGMSVEFMDPLAEAAGPTTRFDRGTLLLRRCR